MIVRNCKQYGVSRVDTFKESMNLTTGITQLYEDKTAGVVGVAKDSDTNEGISGADAHIKNNEEIITTTTTSGDGSFTEEVGYKEYTNPDDPEGNATLPYEELYIKLEKDTYETKTTNPKGISETMNFGDIYMNPILLDFTFKPLTVNGEPMDPATIINFKHGDKTESVTVGGQEEINMNFHATTNKIKIFYESTVTNDIPLYNDATIIHTQNRKWNEEPIANNDITRNRIYNYEPYADTLEIANSKIDGKHDLEFLAMYNYFDHHIHGRLYTNEVAPIGAMISGKTGGYIFTHSSKPNDEGWDLVFLKWDVHTGNPVSSDFIAAWEYGLDQTLDATTRKDGQELFKWTKHYIESPDDPLYQEWVNNDWENTLRITPNSNVSMATNSTSATVSKGIWRGKVTTPPWEFAYNVAIEECYEAIKAFADYDVSSGSYFIKDLELNDMGKTLIRYRNQLGHNTNIHKLP